jgi:hypothetical protein
MNELLDWIDAAFLTLLIVMVAWLIWMIIKATVCALRDMDSEE